MKECKRCKSLFKKDEFPVINHKTGKISSMCPECKREYDRKHYAKHYEENTKLVQDIV